MNLMSLRQPTLDLLKIAEDYRADHCQALLAQASAESRTILKAAHAAARRDLRTLLAPERERLAAEVSAAEAKLVTQRRLRDQRRVAGILRHAWPRVAQVLRERWEAPSKRASWVVHHLSIALRALPAKEWVIQHPEDWPAPEREHAKQWLQAHGIEDARFEADPGLPAGIRVVCGLNVLDASLEGLLADRTQIEGRLLHYLAQEGRAPSAGPPARSLPSGGQGRRSQPHGAAQQRTTVTPFLGKGAAGW
ncbi:MAG: hypothetical protein D4R84_01765 [Rhodocyclaceae bacterium]|nr:MAG: hypothetical protein D4R84_01765 [Rhodocyclaceae bacterium]